MTSRTIHKHYSCFILCISKTIYRNGEHKICYKLVLVMCSVDRQLASYGEWKEIVRANVSTEPSCELAVSSQNSFLQTAAVSSVVL